MLIKRLRRRTDPGLRRDDGALRNDADTSVLLLRQKLTEYAHGFFGTLNPGTASRQGQADG
ncbi:MAG: hypothetical protein GY807_03840 [Gammaproteobacteria bacterium]|nr:hypothetical protein [Gammaproteobacteria bacterium]